ncbi:unnamed protein product [Soboliphyme baturini]|uniref:G_PROTEIN_RECEP_F1_2 domain-containing protein n=1 Tax=Soboliphyme baturini TaxID=241478 RepID=A0A183JAT1_9BILA|nr:unnamed protein product [Soboliphyme baturini]
MANVSGSHTAVNQSYNTVSGDQTLRQIVQQSSDILDQEDEIETLWLIFICSFGIVGIILCLMTLSSQTYRRHSSFALFMMAMCGSDLAYNSINLIANVLYYYGSDFLALSATATKFVGVAFALADMFSAFSNLLSIILSSERFLSIYAPVWYHSLTERRKFNIFLISVTASFVLSSLHLLDCFMYVAEAYTRNGTITYALETTDSIFTTQYVIYNIFINFVLPIASISLMIVFSVFVCCKIRSRHTSWRIRFNGGNRVSSEVVVEKTFSCSQQSAQSSKINLLVAIVAVIFVAEQVSRIMNSVNMFIVIDEDLLETQPLSEEGQREIRKITYFAISSAIDTLVSSVSHSASFYIFFMCSKPFRKCALQQICAICTKH